MSLPDTQNEGIEWGEGSRASAEEGTLMAWEGFRGIGAQLRSEGRAGVGWLGRRRAGAGPRYESW